MENKDISDSWFKLAEIIAVIAGLFVFAGGFLIVSPSSVSNIGNDFVNICDTNVAKGEIIENNLTFQECINTLWDTYGNTLVEANNLGGFLIDLGFLMAVNAIFLWFIGRVKLEKEEFPDKGFGWGLFFVDIIFIIVIYIKIF